ncbi:glycosyltransferase [Sphingomonas bacterium]|uniref:glycosyltransferase n=1 Tax=Sphingomonas bacterium TaxID=1895847 RepID=UPI001C2DCBE4|nr:glycosyltransferase [Sphingomonas bacterium]
MNERLSQGRLIDVAVCTYRRASLETTLRSLATQILPVGTSLRVIVADNDETPIARALVVSIGAELGIDYRYIHAPQRNISVARNACLDAGDAPLLAFIDDDESAIPHWLAALAARLDETGADAVLGPARALYPPGAPAWASRADLHSTTPPFTETDDIRTGYTCNVLLRRSAFGGRRFDLDLGRSGGEDDVFFAGAVRDGARIAYAPDAIVDDPVPIARLTIGWLCRRSFRNGQTYARTRLAAGGGRPILLVTAAGKAVLCLVAAAITAPSAVRWRRMTVRGMLHLGACATYLGRPDLQLY